MSSLNPSIIQVDSFKCRADVPLREAVIKKKIQNENFFQKWEGFNPKVYIFEILKRNISPAFE